MDTTKSSYSEIPGIAKNAIMKSIKDFDVLFAILFTISYVSPTLSTLFSVNTVKSTILLFGGWALSFLLNTFAVKKREGGLRMFLKQVFTSRRIWEFWLLTAWMAILAVNALVGRGVNGHIAFSYYSIFYAVFIMDYCYDITAEKWKTKYVIYTVLAVMAVEYVRGTYVILSENNGEWISRQMAGRFYTTDERNGFMLRGLGAYEVNTGMSILSGIFLLYIIKARYRLPLVVMFLMCMVGMFMSGYTFPVIFACVTLVIATIYTWVRTQKGGRDRKIIPRITIAVIVVFSLLLALSYPLDIGPAKIYADKGIHVYNHNVKPHLYSLLGIPLDDGGEEEDEIPPDGVIMQVVEQDLGSIDGIGLGQIGTRLLLYKQSWRTFTRNWAFGVGPVVNQKVVGVGGHSTWMDYLATFGIFQFGFFIAFVVFMLFRIITGCSGLERFYRLLGLFIFIAYAYINPVISHKVFPVALCLMIGGNMPADGLGYVGDLKPSRSRKAKKSVAETTNVQEMEMPVPSTEG